MKNLSVYEVSSKTLDVNADGEFIACYGHHEENPAGELYVCTHNLDVKNYSEDGQVKWLKNLPEAGSGKSPVNITFLPLSNALCVGLSNGQIYTISDEKCELVGVCDHGLLAMEWSPDQELLVLVTKDMKTILMTSMFDPIHEVLLLSQEFGEQEFITVGWGKKETQFHGSEGKHARVKTEISADADVSDNTVKITWRGDGQLYAVGFNMHGIRRFKVFDKDGLLQFTSEKHQGLEANLAWKPSGSLIATTQRLPDKYLIAFFEKNGLKHGEVTIPVNTTTQVEELSWSSDSEILSLLCSDSSDNTQKVLLFTTSNYHWYLKQILKFSAMQRVNKLLWDNDFDVANNKKLHILLKTGKFYSYTWIWKVDHSAGKSGDDNAIVAVIDGKKVLLTGFRQTIVPPPMAALEIELNAYVMSVHFAPDTGKENCTNSNSFFVCTSDSQLVFYELINKFPLQYKMTRRLTFAVNNFPFKYYNWKWVNKDTVVCVNVEDDAINLLEWNIGSDVLALRNTVLLPSAVTRIQCHPTDDAEIYLQLNNGEILKYTSQEDIEPQDIAFPISCPNFSIIINCGNLHFLGLSHKGNFFFDNALIMNNVSSFYVHSHFLLLTTLKHLLLCTELSKDGLNAIKGFQNNESALVYQRKIERGAKLVIAVPNDTRTVFQMPRGNLEAIQPRPLSLQIIGEYLDNVKYKEAFDLMRKQRINLNLIYDHAPSLFINNVDVFLNDININSWLSLFLTELENVDVTKSMYSSSYATRDVFINCNSNHTNKVERICDIIREKLSEREDKDSKVLPLLTTFVKKNSVKDLEDALTIVKKLKEQESAGARLPVGSDEALKYLLYMVEVNQLFDIALGMYDFDLVLLVANKSQKDPKEYIPMLNELNAMEENFRKFTVNKHLKRFERAVECLALCGPHKYGELRSFIKYHSLYREGLQLFSPEEEIFRQIAEDYGMYLKLKKQYTEAGIIYRRANSLEKAVECFKEALDWEMAIELCKSWPEEQFHELCRDMAEGLKEEKRHQEALTLLERYCGDIEAAVEYAADNGQFRTALRLCSEYNKNIIAEVVVPALLREFTQLYETIALNWVTFSRHTDRLRIVREKKAKKPAEVYDPSYNNKDCDLYSDAGSTVASSASRSSSRSHRSSKNRRKHERKVASLKEGSQYEDVALVMALHTVVTATFELRSQVREICIALSCCGKDNEVTQLQRGLEKLLKDMKDSLKEIWTPELVLEATNAEIEARNVPEGCQVTLQGIATLEPHLRIAPVIMDINWKLNSFE